MNQCDVEADSPMRSTLAVASDEALVISANAGMHLPMPNFAGATRLVLSVRFTVLLRAKRMQRMHCRNPC
jgi:hypothetical protein